jgi:hypothetical protein
MESMVRAAVLSTGFSAVAALLLWEIAFLGVRTVKFNHNGTRTKGMEGGERQSEEIEYHNNAIYRDFEFFYKVTLAILGGVGFVVTRINSQSMDATALLLRFAGALQVASAVIFALFIFFHQKSKVERWDTRYSWLQPLAWQECWMIAAMWAISSGVAVVAVPLLVSALKKS